MSVLDNSVLVLNTGWMPVDVTTVYEAVLKVCRDTPRALFVDSATYATYGFEAWVDTWEDAIRASKFQSDEVIESPCLAFRLPEVIMLTGYGGNGYGRSNQSRPPKFSRRNVYARDSSTCQYCGRKCLPKESNLDHVIPKSRGGQMSWKNIVVSCIPCNDRKQNRTPVEAGMNMLRSPRVPQASDLSRSWKDLLKQKLGGRLRPGWENFLGKMYWDVGLRDD